MSQRRQIYVDQRVSRRESLPSSSDAAEVVDDSLVAAQEIGMRVQILLVRHFAASGSLLNDVQRMQR
jgi:hypothetical protein